MSSITSKYDHNKPKVLYVHYGENWLRGSEIVLLDLLKSALNNHANPMLWCNSQVLAEKAQDLGVEVILDKFVCLGYWIEPRWQFKQFFKLILKAKQIIKAHNITLVHCNNGAPCQWMVPACKLSHIPLLLHLHAKYRYRDRLTLFFHGADSIIGVSHAVVEVFNKNEFFQQKISIIHNGVDPHRIVSSKPRDIRAELSAKSDDFVMLYMGSLIPRKLVHNLVIAVKELIKRNKVKLAVIGSGSDHAKLVALSAQLKLENHIKFFPQSYQVADIYTSNVDCFISVPEEEVFGLTLAEASLAKIPIITSNISGINEIYAHQETALLVSPNNVNELINTIESSISLPKNRLKMAAMAHKHIATHFTLKQQYTAIDLAYNELLTDKNLNTSFCYALLIHSINLIKSISQKLYNYFLTKVC